MFELFGDQPARQAIREVAVAQAAHIGAIVSLLIHKGIITQKEFDDFLASVTSHCDQVVAAKDEEKRLEFEREHPGLSKFVEALIGKEPA